jgi:SAM-dependent methyltransferase/putative flippase GtrA
MLRRLILPLANDYGIGFLVYCGVAAVSALSEWACFLVALSKMGPNAAAILAFFVATLINLLLSRSIAFRSVRRLRTEVMLVIAMSAIAFAPNFLCFVALYRYAGLNVFAAKVSGTLVGFAFNYIVRQFFIFSQIPLHKPVSVVLPLRHQGDTPATRNRVNSLDGEMTITPKQGYAGNRILEAMRSGVRYGEAIFRELRAAVPEDTYTILDFGAGTGFFLEKFHAIGVAVDAVEQDADLQATVRPLAGTVWSDIHNVPNESFDFVYTVNVLEHIFELDEACAHLSRVLKPNRKLFVFVPAHEILWTSLDNEVQHVRRFDRRSLRLVLERAGFRIENMKYFDSLGFPAALGVRVLEQVNLFKYGSRSVALYDSYLFPVSRQLDRLFKGGIGKNLIAIASRP